MSFKLRRSFLTFNLDMNSGTPLGVGWLQSTVGGGKRSTSATSYLAPKFIQRETLHVLLHAQVSRLVNSSSVDGKLAFGGVEFLQGSVGTPTILMHSGIGDRTTLTALGIPSLLDLNSVGKNATDQPIIGASWSVNSTQTVNSITQNITRYNEAFAQWNRTHTGPFVELGPTHIAWLRLDEDSPIFNNVTDPSAGPHTPHIEMSLSPSGASTEPGHFMSMGLVVLTPSSRPGGSVTINSSNPFDAPIIDLGFLESDFDIFTAREAIKRAYRFVQAPVWRDYIIAPTTDLANLSMEALDEYIRNGATPSAHLIGTAAMSEKNASYGVVDPDLLIKGTIGVRIIDASILLKWKRQPLVPSAHTQAAAYVVGERGADLIKESWK
ncbi:hypothetical protein FB451DRAFT_1187393 [Mycena latifolia]|nr:hypothetical protein FB451DRAFT_1187393 [Mycena latifolia]